MRVATMPNPLTDANRDEAWPLAATIGVFLAAFALMTWPWLLGRVSIPWDSKAHFLPQIQFLAQSLWAGEMPWWNPYVFAGQPQIADPQSMIFSPPYLLLALVNSSPGPWAQDLTLLATMAAGGIGLIVWFRDRQWHWAGALVAAIVFTFGAAMAWRIQHTGQVLSLAYLPWALLLLDRAIERSSIAAGIGSGIVAAFIVLGRDQVALMLVYLLVARVGWHWATADTVWPRFKRSLLPLVAAGIAGLALVAIPVLMTVLLAADSNRPVIDFAGAGAGSLHPAQLVTLVIPQLFGAAGDMADYWGPPSFAWVGTGLFTAQNVGQLYIGLLPLLLILGGAVTGRLWDRDIRFFSIAFGIVLLYGLGWYTPAFRLLYEALPGVNLYRRPADAVFLIGGLGGILAGYAVHAWFVAPWERHGPRLVVVVASVVAIAFGAAVLFGLNFDRLGRVAAPAASAAMWLAAAIVALAFAAPRIALQPKLAAGALALVATLDLGINNGPSSSSALPPATFEALQPATGNAIITSLKKRVVRDAQRRDRIELAGLGFHWPNASMTHRLENTLGYNPVRLGHYSRATGAEDHIGLPDQRKFSALMPSYRSMLADMLGLRWIATPVPVSAIDKLARPDELPLVDRPAGAYIYENPTALPRVLFAAKAQVADFEDILKSGRWPNFDPRSTVLLEAVAKVGVPRQPGTARLVRYGQTRIEIEVSSADGGWVVLNDVWHPWWSATVAGQPATIERANVLFRAVEVKPGTHAVVMEFQPLNGIWRDLRRSSPDQRGRRP